MKKYNIILSLALLAGLAAPMYAKDTLEHRIDNKYNELNVAQKKAVIKRVIKLLTSLENRLERFINSENNQEKIPQVTMNKLISFKEQVSALKKQKQQKLDELDQQAE